MIGRQVGLVGLGHVVLDGSKVKANASKHKAMSYERMEQAELRLEREGAASVRTIFSQGVTSW